jgi:hypothetical protein
MLGKLGRAPSPAQPLHGLLGRLGAPGLDQDAVVMMMQMPAAFSGLMSHLATTRRYSWSESAKVSGNPLSDGAVASATSRRWRRSTPTVTYGRTPRTATREAVDAVLGRTTAADEEAARRASAPVVPWRATTRGLAQVRPVAQGEPACKPASVPREVPGWRPSIWDRRCRRPHAVHQGTRPGQPPRPRRRDRYVPYSTLLRVGFA